MLPHQAEYTKYHFRELCKRLALNKNDLHAGAKLCAHWMSLIFIETFYQKFKPITLEKYA